MPASNRRQYETDEHAHIDDSASARNAMGEAEPEPLDTALNRRLVAVISSVDAMLDATAAWQESNWKLATLTDDQVEQVVEPARKMFTRLDAMHIEDLKAAVMEAMTKGALISSDALRSAHLILMLLPRYGRLYKQLEFFLAQSAVYRLLQEWHDTYQKLLRFEAEKDDAKFLYETTNLATIMDEAVYVSWEEIPELYLQQTDVMELKAKQMEEATLEEADAGNEGSSEDQAAQEALSDRGIPTWLNRLTESAQSDPIPKSPPPVLDTILLPESWSELLVASPTFAHKPVRAGTRSRIYVGSDTLESCPEIDEDDSFDIGSLQAFSESRTQWQAYPKSLGSEAVLSDLSLSLEADPSIRQPSKVEPAPTLSIDDQVQQVVDNVLQGSNQVLRKSTRELMQNDGSTANHAKTHGWYNISKHDGSCKDIYCRIVGSRVMARVGGGWQDLASFLAHWSSNHASVPIRSITPLPQSMPTRSRSPLAFGSSTTPAQLLQQTPRRTAKYRELDGNSSGAHPLISRHRNFAIQETSLPRVRASSDSLSTAPLSVRKALASNPSEHVGLRAPEDHKPLRYMRSTGQL
ncbi:hypothetical protein BCR37DRAFT_70894 [Protomyces lactucae-debilis]|uniref:GAR domain-containing protein n=1 Tax=Protomyces lactucae-debilis TaxID=2754530 RepID=A0A1Y2FC93_PROLT|nr:uncharacterized protein BCR37DRAFT_70894 [Protomyces lactucae-debilis]ORY80475.1 hypothetical protein BCR37DRAFT_70894 [Protomyces lactucae-debilis]